MNSGDKVILVNRDDFEIGQEDKVRVHLGQGKLHRAFSIFVFNNQNELLIQKRASGKTLWPGCWSNTCCSHPRPGEDIIMAGRRRLQEELGFSCALKDIGFFIYEAKFKDVGSENELCYVLFGHHDGGVKTDPAEVEEIKWIKLSDALEEVKINPDVWTPWLRIELEKFAPTLGQKLVDF